MLHSGNIKHTGDKCAQNKRDKNELKPIALKHNALRIEKRRCDLGGSAPETNAPLRAR